MITLVTGKIGGGKTILSLFHALEHLSKGGLVISNIALRFEDCYKYVLKNYKRHIRPEQIIFHDFEELPYFMDSPDFRRGTTELKVLVIIDECHIFYHADSSKAKFYKPVLDFLTLSRKFDVDIYLITQEPTTLYSQFRHQCQFTYYCLDMRQQSISVFGQLPMMGLQWSKRDTKSNSLQYRGVTKISQLLFNCFDTKQTYSKATRLLMEKTAIFEPVNTKKKLNNDKVLRNDCVRGSASRWRRFLGLHVDPKGNKSGQSPA